MAKGYSGGLVGGLTGKAGDVVFVHQRNGSVTVRPYTVPHDPKTAAQQKWRNLRTKAAQGYNALTPAQYAQWQQFAPEALSDFSDLNIDFKDPTKSIKILAADILYGLPAGKQVYRIEIGRAHV